MKINLNEIPEEGCEYDFNRETGELNVILADLLGTRPYDVRMMIRPLGNAYEVRGKLKTHLPALCSKCGWDIEVAIDRSMNEVLVEEPKEDRKSHSVHGNQSVDFSGEGLSVTYYQNHIFDAGEFVHEVVALSVPFYPTCLDEKCEHLEDVLKKRAALEEEYRRGQESQPGHPAFAALRKLLPANDGGESET